MRGAARKGGPYRDGFISADRWMRNQYGRKLRALIGDGYSMDVNLEMHNVDAFEVQVSAYPAVTVISRRPQGSAVFANAGSGFGKPDAAELSDWVAAASGGALVKHNVNAGVLPHWFVGEPSWPTGSIERLRMIEDLNDRFDLLENVETGTRVGIGVATGADGVFVTANPPNVEPDRLLPLSMTRDIVSGRVEWSGHYLINPWAPDGRLVDLADHPRMADYLQTNGPALLKRHIALKRPSAWYRTIDKVDHELTKRPKLLFPDMKLTAHPVLDEIGLYPHHNLYYVVSRDWDLRVLGGLLLSKVAELFVDAYSVRMRGGTLRFQAQYLRRIRVPDPASLSRTQADGLAAAFAARDAEAATKIACVIYGIARIPI